MGHEITADDEVFSVREPMWHGLGEVWDEYPTRAEAQAKVHPWEPVSEPLFRRMVEVVHDPACPPECPQHDQHYDLVERYEEVEEAKLNVRSDTHTSLGVVSDTHTAVSNTELWDIAEAIQGGSPKDVLFETAGSLMGGRKVWVLIRLAEPLVIKGDPNGTVVPYYALQNSHDGSGSFRGQATMTRVVCGNTSKAADADAQARGTEFVFRHTKNVGERVEEARQALAGWRESVGRWQRLQELLVDSPVNGAGVLEFIKEFIPMPAAGTVSDRVRSNVDEGQKQLLTILKGQTCEGVAMTAYGLVQASIEYLNWVRPARTSETRFKRAYLDRSTIVADAQEIACRVAGVTL